MRNVYVLADNIFSPLGKDTAANMKALKQNVSGIREQQTGFSGDPFYASLFTEADNQADDSLSFFEQIVYASAMNAMQRAGIHPGAGKTGFILSTTKGNIGLIDLADEKGIAPEQISLNTSAERIGRELGFLSEPLVISHACISGLLAMITGMRMIQSGILDTVVISGADLIGSFIYSGFKSFQAISPTPCRPFDADRDGITLGEAAASVILSAEKQSGAVRISGGSVSNDANHISGPSRTGEELALAIQSTLRQAGLQASDIQFISAHGTATRYNDDMEAKAIHLAALQEVPVNSLKGYYGHTLGAAGLLESIVTIHSMRGNFMLPTRGFTRPGTEKPVHVVKDLTQAEIPVALKTASGFGGCNAVIALEI